MRKIIFILISGVVFSPLLALAHGATETEEMMGGWSMMGWGNWGWFGWILPILFWITLALGLIVLIKWLIGQIKK